MKKVRTGILAAALLLSIGVTGALAAGPGWGRHAGQNGSCPAAGAACRYIDADGDGVCDNCGVDTCGSGANYVDADGDGVCDHFDGSRCGSGRGMGRGYRR